MVDTLINSVICLLKVIEDYSGLVTAIATFVIGWFTGSIRSINREQLSHTRDIERAYLSGGGDVVERGIYTNLAPPEDKFWWDIHNDGKTVAYLTHYAVHACDFRELVKLNEPFDEKAAYKKHVYPDTIPPNVRKIINAAKPLKILKSDNPVVYGRFWYEDIWRKPHIFSFIQSIKKGKSYSDVVGISPEYTKWT